MAMNIKSPLKLQSSLSKIEELSVELNNIEVCILNYFDDGAIIVVWQLNQIAWGILKNNKIVFSDMTEWKKELCQELRVFDINKEIHVMKSEGMFIGRLHIDGDGVETKFVDSIAPMWGYVSEVDCGFSKLKDHSRKLSLTVPVEISEGKRCGLVTRNYVISDVESGLSGYGDYRYLALQEMEV